MTRDDALREAERRLSVAERINRNRRNIWGDKYGWAFGDDKSLEIEEAFMLVVVEALKR